MTIDASAPGQFASQQTLMYQNTGRGGAVFSRPEVVTVLGNTSQMLHVFERKRRVATLVRDCLTTAHVAMAPQE